MHSIGPYDFWAIEYAYKPIEADKEKEELSRIANRSSEPQLAFSNDQDANGFSSDPDVNIFDLSERGSGTQKDVYAENDWTQPRTISHIALRTRNAERCARFYAEVFELKLTSAGGQFALSDGRVTLRIMPWRLSDYYGQDPARTGLDHIGFTVESVEEVKRDLDFLTGENPHLRTRPLGYGSEGEARLKLLQKCPLGCFQLTDIEGVHIDIAE